MVLLRTTLYIIFALLVALPASAKKKQPKEVAALSVEQEQQFTYYWYAAKEAIMQEQFPEALTLLEFCRTIKPNDGQTLAYLGLMRSSMGKKEEAEELFRLAYEADPAGQWERYLMPKLEKLADAKQYKEAIKVQDEIDMRRKKYEAQSAYTRCMIYTAWGKPKKALAALDKYLEIDPDNLYILGMRVDLMEKMGVKYQALFPYYDRVLALNPGHLTTLNNYAYFLAITGGDLNKAEKMSATTLQEEPDNPVYLDTYGWIMHLQGKDDLALFYLQRALNNAKNERVKAEVEKHLKALRAVK